MLISNLTDQVWEATVRSKSIPVLPIFSVNRTSAPAAHFIRRSDSEIRVRYHCYDVILLQSMFQHRAIPLFAIFLSLIIARCALSFSVPSSCHSFNGGKIPTVLPSMTSEGSDVCPMHDTWVVGSGTLGTHIISQLQSQCAGGKIVAETRSEARKKELEGMGALHVTRDQRIDKDYGTARNVIICLPPSCSSSYSAEVSEATRLWAGRKGGGNLVYTSSIGVYGDAPGCTVSEATPVNDSPESVSK